MGKSDFTPLVASWKDHTIIVSGAARKGMRKGVPLAWIQGNALATAERAMP